MRTHDIQLEHIIKQLNDIQSLLRSHTTSSSRIVLNGFEKDIVVVVAEKPLKATAIARRLKCKCNSHFRAILSFLVRAGVLAKTSRGYVPADCELSRIICMKTASGLKVPTGDPNCI